MPLCLLYRLVMKHRQKTLPLHFISNGRFQRHSHFWDAEPLIESFPGKARKNEKRCYQTFNTRGARATWWFRETPKVLSKDSAVGLILINQYAKLMGGELGFVSEYGVGSTFCVTLKFQKYFPLEYIRTDVASPPTLDPLPSSTNESELTATSQGTRMLRS